MTWTETAIARLRELWSEGVPTAEIGRRLRFSKNAIIGKAHRIDLPPRPTPIKTGNPSAPKRQARPRAPVSSLPHLALLTDRPHAPAPLPEPGPQHRAVREPTLPKNSAAVVTSSKPCCWPIGTPGAPGFRFCEAPALVSKPYCPEHAKRAYARKRDRREDADPRRSEAMRQP